MFEFLHEIPITSFFANLLDRIDFFLLQCSSYSFEKEHFKLSGKIYRTKVERNSELKKAQSNSICTLQISENSNA